MIVIKQPVHKASLPQPAGPSSASGHVAQRKSAAGASSNSAATQTQQRKRTMARSASMIQPHLSDALSIASRSSSPMTSAASLRSSPGAANTSTPASTVLSSVASGSGRRTKQLDVPTGSRRLPAVSPISPSPRKEKGSTCDDPAAIAYDVPRNVAVPNFARPSSNVQRDLARIWEAAAGARRIVVICGAGISVSSPANIPDFRSAHGLFRKLKEKHPNVGLQSGKDLFDASLFNSPSTSAAFYSMVSELKAMADAATPTTFHHLLKRLDMEGRLMRVYTQNIDGLEEKAGLTFGLGESAGDSRATLRALGKRKREEGMAMQRKGGMARSKSDSAVLLNRPAANEQFLDGPMFPRTIPLHGSLSTMTCRVCGHKVYLSLASPGPQRLPTTVRELSPDASDQAVNAMDLLSQGEPVSCKQCEAHESVRTVAGLRSRGVGMMKVDVVLYNGQNEGAERVGDCVERDILGLRDPNETMVPESHHERMARERKERKEQAGRTTSRSRRAKVEESPFLAPIKEASNADEAFAAAFGDDDDDEALDVKGLLEIPKATPVKSPSKPKRQARLKALPPDLLIVAGTSLKVPGTKRIVREFAKACRARDYREYPSDEEGSDDGNDSDEDDPSAPIRSVLLNYDFPDPHGQWEDVFDVWVQGDVQQSALGLWGASTYPDAEQANGEEFSMRPDEGESEAHSALSWSQWQAVLAMERKLAKMPPGPVKETAPTANRLARSTSAPVKSGPLKRSGTMAAPSLSQTSLKLGSKKTAVLPTLSKTGKAAAAVTKSSKPSSPKKMSAPASSAAKNNSPVKKKAKQPVKSTSIPVSADAGLGRYVKGSKATFARSTSLGTAKPKKAAL